MLKCSQNMSTKSLIWLGIAVGSTIGGLIGSRFDHGSFFGVWGLTLGTVGSFVGIWVGFKIGNL